MLAPNLDIAGNIFLGNERRGAGGIAATGPEMNAHRPRTAASASG